MGGEVVHGHSGNVHNSHTVFEPLCMRVVFDYTLYDFTSDVGVVSDVEAVVTKLSQRKIKR